MTPSSRWGSGSSDNPLVQGRSHSDRAHSPPWSLVVAEKSYEVGLQKKNPKKKQRKELELLFMQSSTIAEQSALQPALIAEG